MLLLAQIVHRIIQLFILVIVVQAILSYFMSPYEPIRRTIDRFVNPFLEPIRRVLPLTGGLDFSPFVLIILLYIIDAILMRLFISFL
ncbi:MAG: YggT family protein [Anaerolineales bacterium]|nr:YggT family protein [Anaerolineales bacterium]